MPQRLQRRKELSVDGHHFPVLRDGACLILEPLHDVDSLAGSLGTGRPSVSIEKIKQGAKAAIARAGR